MSDFRLMREIAEAALRMEIGRCFTIPDAYGAGWDQLPTVEKRQAAKDFKIAVSRRQIRGVIWVERDKHRTWIYKRIPVPTAINF